ncbi:MAG: FtsQ-type POTRA domain-containing protein [Firmicutes bacterium]|nr:FtsQ-type POTRA domain-containing protein [Bacillota bacterium]
MRNNVSGTRNALYVLVLAFVIALYLFSNSSFFEVAGVEWTGLVYLDAEQLDLFLDLPAVNVWRLNTGEVAAVLQEHPWIEKAKVIWRWPNRIRIAVQERAPLAQIPSPGGWVLLDKEGNLLSPTLGITVYPLPIITNIELDSPEQLLAAARLFNTIPDNLREFVSEWNAAERSFITRGGTEIVVGELADLEEKFILLETILEDLALQNKNARKIDLRVPKNPVVSFM